MLHVDYITNSIFNSRTYILSDGSEKVWLVDCDGDFPMWRYTPTNGANGHNPSCLCHSNDDVIFTGDAYIPGCKVVTNLPHCDKALAEASLRRIQSLSEGKVIYPGHEG